MAARTVIVLLVVLWAEAHVAGPAFAASSTKQCATASGNNWTSATNVLANDANYAVYNTTAQDQLQVTDCSFSIPIGSTINGVTVRWIGCGTGTTAQRRIAMNLVGAGTCTAKTAINQAQCTSWTDSTQGGSADTWSCTSLTVSAVNNSAFGVAIYDNDTTATELREQFAEITVTYTEPSGGRRRVM